MLSPEGPGKKMFLMPSRMLSEVDTWACWGTSPLGLEGCDQLVDAGAFDGNVRHNAVAGQLRRGVRGLDELQQAAAKAHEGELGAGAGFAVQAKAQLGVEGLGSLQILGVDADVRKAQQLCGFVGHVVSIPLVACVCLEPGLARLPPLYHSF